jgi:hypothetical protein
MTRRAASRTALGPSLPLLAGMLVIGMAAGLLAACGGGNGGSPQPTATVTVTASPSASPSPSPSPSASPSPAAATLSLYFLRRGKFGVAERRVPQTTTPAAAALKALLKGPSVAERAAGLSTAIRPGVKLNSIVIAGGLARLDLSRFPSASGSPASESLNAAAQIVYTLTRFGTVSRVSIRVNDQPFPAAGGADSPSVVWRRADFRALEPAIFVESPGVGAVLGSPFSLSGTASVFEGSFTAVLVDSSGRRVVRKQVNASQGAPGRGRFRMTVPWTTSATAGTLIVYDQSMEDGSRLDQVRIPVTFAQN